MDKYTGSRYSFDIDELFGQLECDTESANIRHDILWNNEGHRSSSIFQRSSTDPWQFDVNNAIHSREQSHVALQHGQLDPALQTGDTFPKAYLNNGAQFDGRHVPPSDFFEQEYISKPRVVPDEVGKGYPKFPPSGTRTATHDWRDSFPSDSLEMDVIDMLSNPAEVGSSHYTHGEDENAISRGEGNPPRHHSSFCSGLLRDSSPQAGLSPILSLHQVRFSSPQRDKERRRDAPSVDMSNGNRDKFRHRDGMPTGNQVPGPLLQQLQLNHAPPMAQGIPLVPLNQLPDRFRSVFPFPLFNAMQSRAFHASYKTDDNLVLSAPTGSGKTAVLELAICRLLTASQGQDFKVVYQAPTKCLCAERFRDWQAKFAPLDLQCALLTGDTEHGQLWSVQHASIIITTPEKWDSVTRRWKDHTKLMRMVKLFLVDEVHMLKEMRGATLEAVVSRMKSLDSPVRFVALSATVPNSDDIAAWLGKNSSEKYLPAHVEKFDEGFRPVKLQKFVYGFASNGNDFAFDKFCDTRLPDVISKHACKKPIIIFCSTRKSALSTAQSLAKLWSSLPAPSRLWPAPSSTLRMQNQDLQACISAGVAFHHAGLDLFDRQLIEKGYLSGQLYVICCTSTLAVGINLPCHLVIIKNTVSWQGSSCQEYSDLEVMQMIGRAGRPQYDDSAVAAILTRQEKVVRYEKMMSGEEILESCLHRNLIDHLNAEIGLGTLHDLPSAKKWLSGTFLYVRLQKNPGHYQIENDSGERDVDKKIGTICDRDLQLLQDYQLIEKSVKLKCTEFGDAMSRYYISFKTMKIFLSLQQKAKMSEILSVIAQADEYREIRFRSGEKSLYKEINKNASIKFPIKVDLALPAHKVSLIIQSELGAVDYPSGDQFQKHKIQYIQEKNTVFLHLQRLIRCIIDCQLCLGDSVAARHALELSRSFGAKAWDNSALQLKQLDQIGLVGVRKLAAGGITGIEALEATEPHKIEMIMTRNPPWGRNVLEKVRAFPKLSVSIQKTGKEIKGSDGVNVHIKAEVCFINEKIPTMFHRKPVFVCFMAEVSDGKLLDFRRIRFTLVHSWFKA